jgi:hypothetical protein
MDTFSTSELKRLTATQVGPCVTIYMPTHPAGIADQQDALRLKNLVGEAERRLTDQGLRTPEAKQLLEPLRELPAEAGFWGKRSQGLALFVANGHSSRFRLPESVAESVVVNRRFQVKALLPLVSAQHRFFVLALSQKQVRFLEGNRFTLKAVPVEGLPADITQALNYDTTDRGHPVHPAGRGDAAKNTGVFHSQGAERDTSKEDLAHYFRLIDGALRPTLRDQRTPLVLAGVQYLLPIYREVSAYPHIADVELSGNPDHLSELQLHERIWPLIQPQLDQVREDAAGKYRQLAGTGKTSADIREIVVAAAGGQIETLFVDRTAHLWGCYDPATGQVQCRDETQSAQPGEDDLLDLAAVQTALNRGVVFAVPRDQSPAPPIAAVFRY